MRKSEIYDRCVFETERAYLAGKWNAIKVIRKENYAITTGVVLSTTDSAAGTVSRAWGIIFSDPDLPARCTEVHVSYYGESVVLEKLLKEVTAK